MTTVEPIVGDALIPDVYASILGTYLTECFELYVEQGILVLDEIPEPTSPNGSVFIDLTSTRSDDDYHIGSYAPLSQIHKGEVTILTKHAQMAEGRRHLRLLTTNLRRFLGFNENALIPLLSQATDQMPTGSESFRDFKLLASEYHPRIGFKGNKLHVSTTEFEIKTETTCTWLNP